MDTWLDDVFSFLRTKYMMPVLDVLVPSGPKLSALLVCEKSSMNSVSSMLCPIVLIFMHILLGRVPLAWSRAVSAERADCAANSRACVGARG